jgi:hypothetical protein
MADSKITLKIEIEGSGEIVEQLGQALREFFKIPQTKPAPELPKRFEDCPPAPSLPAHPVNFPDVRPLRRYRTRS